jgi:hypothetical protein
MIAYQTICPCKGCGKREQMCHSKCKEYNDWKGNAIEIKREFINWDERRKKRRPR